MTPTVCPYLGLLDDPEAHLNYASFENRCYATVARESIVLSEQAVFCLGGQYRSCPRFMAVHGSPQPDSTIETAPLPPPYASTPLSTSASSATGASTPPMRGGPTYVPAGAPVSASGGRGRDWSLAIILGGTLVGIFICVGLVAAYLGLRALVTTTLPATPTTVVAVVIPTATSSPTVMGPAPTDTPATDPTEPVGPPPVVVEPTPTPDFDPSPILPEPPSPTPAPPDDEDRPTPTPRPPPTLTPAPTSPQPTSTPTSAFTPTPGAVSITFTASATSIAAGQCVTFSWNVQNAQRVEFDERGVAGSGSREECPLVTTVFTLTVVDLRGATTRRNITITVGPGTPTVTPTRTVTWTPWPTLTPTPTHTITPTPTESPTPTLTPTITPTSTPVPTFTPTPFVIQWDISPGDYSGPGPQVGITMINRSTVSDAMFINLENVALPADWQVVVCNGAGNCADRSILTAELPPGGAELATVRFTYPDGVPATAQGSLEANLRSLKDFSFVRRIPITIRFQ